MAFQRRLHRLFLIACLAMTAIWLRVGQLQILEHDHWVTQAQEKRTRRIVREAPRGRIVDIEGRVIAEDEAVYQLAFVGWEWARRGRVRCTGCGAVHFHHVKRGRPRRTCRCAEPDARLEPLPLPDPSALEVLLELAPGELSRRADERVAEVEEMCRALEARLEAAGEPQFLINDALRLREEDLLLRPYVVVERISDDVVGALERDEDGRYRGFRVATALRRAYPQGDLAPQLIGFVNAVRDAEEIAALREQLGADFTHDARIGREGGESFYNHLLFGHVGYEVQMRDEDGAFTVVVKETPPEPGQELRLTMSVEACRAAENVIERYGQAEGYFPGARPSGGFVAMDAKTGEIVAWGEMPRFDLGSELHELFDETAAGAVRDAGDGLWRPAGGLRPGETMEALRARLSKPAPLHLSRVAQIAVEPGSTLKTLIGLGMLESGVGLPYGVFVCGGRGITPGCHVHGAVDFEEAIATSCNRYFALSLRDHVGHWPTYRHTVGALLHDLGLGRRTGVDIAREHQGTWLRDWVDFDPRVEVRRAVADVGEAFAGRGVAIRHEFLPGIPTRVAGRSADRLYGALVAVLEPLAAAAAPGHVLIRVGGARAKERGLDLHAEIRFRREGGWDAEHRVDPSEVEAVLRGVGAVPEVGIHDDGSASVVFTLAYHEPIGREAGDPPLILPDDGRNVAIGQGPVQVTPLQMARAMAVLANGGRLVTPRIAKSANGVALRAPVPVELGLHPTSLARVREGMRRVVQHGTAASAGWGRVQASVYGKTGTAQTGEWWRPGEQIEDGPWHHWFVGFAEAPGHRTVAFACVLHSRTEQAAGRTAVHAARDFLRWWYEGEPR